MKIYPESISCGHSYQSTFLIILYIC